MNEHSLISKNKLADIEVTMGMCVINYHASTMIDLGCVMRVEDERRELSNSGPVLHIIPSDSPLVEQEALTWLGSDDAMQNVVARAIVVPSNLAVLQDKIRWVLFRQSVPFRIFRNPQVAKGWLIDVWYEELAKEKARISRRD
ncbi:MAG: hypothetical protein COA49_01720 [Bacteroidetes bacterium]|nr:MAG: hypothetical protein COA49_01720 [Bacteroidota bacterium]